MPIHMEYHKSDDMLVVLKTDASGKFVNPTTLKPSVYGSSVLLGFDIADSMVEVIVFSASTFTQKQLLHLCESTDIPEEVEEALDAWISNNATDAG